MCKKIVLLTFVLLLGFSGSASALLPPGWLNQDIGTTGAAGSADESNGDGSGTWTVTGSGRDMWNQDDEFHLVYTTLRGDGEISARVASIPDQHDWQKAGVTIRESVDARSPHVSHVMRETDRGGSAQWRPGYSSNSQSDNHGNPDTPQWVRVVREGDTFRTYLSDNGTSWTLHNNRVKYVPMKAEVLIGLCVTSHVNGTLSTCTFDDVKLTLHDPDAAWDPNSKNGARGVGIDADIAWAAGDSATAHEVYWGLSAGSLAKVADKALGDESYDPGTLAYATEYFWQIIEVGGAVGPVWSFTTIPDPAVNPDPALVGYYAFEGNYDDSSGYGNHGTPTGDPTLSAGLGGYGSALFLDGNGDAVNIGEGPQNAYDFNHGQAFSITAWTFIEAWSSNWAHIIVGKHGDGNQSWQLRRRNDDRFNFTTRRIDNDDGNTEMPPLNEWVHIACVIDASDINNKRKRVYYNGIQKSNGSSKAGTVMNPDDRPVFIGARSNGNGDAPEKFFTGMIDEVRLYTRALAPGEVGDLALLFSVSVPDPGDGEKVGASGVIGTDPWMTLDYTVGPTAVAHEGFFSDDYDAIANRVSGDATSLGGPFPGAVPPHIFYVGAAWAGIPLHAQGPLSREKWYYWAVDVDDGSVIIPGDVWSFLIKPVEAWNPTPADGATYVPATSGVDLSWELGDADTTGQDLKWDIYYGTDKAAVEAATVPDVELDPATIETTGSHTLTGLPLGVSMYWRVDTRLIGPPDSVPPFSISQARPTALWISMVQMTAS